MESAMKKKKELKAEQRKNPGLCCRNKAQAMASSCDSPFGHIEPT